MILPSANPPASLAIAEAILVQMIEYLKVLQSLSCTVGLQPHFHLQCGRVCRAWPGLWSGALGYAGQVVEYLTCFQIFTCEFRLQMEYIAAPPGSRHYGSGGGKTMRNRHSFGLNLRRRFRWALRMAAVRRLRQQHG